MLGVEAAHHGEAPFEGLDKLHGLDMRVTPATRYVRGVHYANELCGNANTAPSEGRRAHPATRARPTGGGMAHVHDAGSDRSTTTRRAASRRSTTIPRTTCSRTCSRWRPTPRPWEKVAVAKNMEYVLEVIRAEGTSRVAGDPARRVRPGRRRRGHRRTARPRRAAGRPPTPRVRSRVDGEPSGTPMGRVVAGHGHMALLPAGRCYRFVAERAERDPAADDRGPRHRLPLGRDLPDRADARASTTMTDDHRPAPPRPTPASRQRARLPIVPHRRVHVRPRRALRPHRLAHRQPRHVGRGLPQGGHARRRLELLLRHRQLRRRDRHDEPLRQRRPVRRPLQRRLPQGRARPPGELPARQI